jgi:hypothetical protein
LTGLDESQVHIQILLYLRAFYTNLRLDDVAFILSERLESCVRQLDDVGDERGRDRLLN